MNQKGFANNVLVVVIVLVVGAVCYFVFVKKSEPVVQQPTPTQTQTKTSNPTPTATPKNETASWKTYDNAEFNYELKYPTNWQVFSKTIKGPGAVSKGTFLNNPSLLDPKELKDSAHSTHFAVLVYVDSALEDVIAHKKGGRESTVTVTSQKYLGYNATAIENYHMFEKTTAEWIVFQKDGKVFAVGYQYYPYFSEIDALNQIFSTVKFTN